MLSIVLVTTGKKTGQLREVRLYAFADGDGLIVLASGSGKPSEPKWAGNLRAQPRASIRRGRSVKSQSVVAREIGPGAERDRLWAIAAAEFPYYERYQQRTSWPIAVFVLEPLEAEHQSE